MKDQSDQPKDRVYHILLVCLLLVFPLHAFSSMSDAAGPRLLALGNVLTLLGCVIAMSRGHLRIVAVMLSLPTVWLVLSPEESGTVFALSGDLFALVVYGYVIYALCRRIYSELRISAADISAAMSIYLLMGLVWARLYGLVLQIDPEAFRGPEGLHEAHIESALFYFSFVTLSTLGYGDISPVGPIAMSLATLEAIVGQLFLVVGVATVVSAATNNKAS